MHGHYFTFLALRKLLWIYDPNWFCCQLFLVLPRHMVVISPPLPQNYLLSPRSPLMSVSQTSLAQLNRLTASRRSCFLTLMSYVFHCHLICLHVSLSVPSKTKARVPVQDSVVQMKVPAVFCISCFTYLTPEWDEIYLFFNKSASLLSLIQSLRCFLTLCYWAAAQSAAHPLHVFEH